MLALSLTFLALAGGAADLKVLDIQVYTFDRKSGEMAPIDERAKPSDWAGDLIAIVRTSGSTPTTQLTVRVLEGKKKRLDETRGVGDGTGNYELFFIRAGMLCAETTVTATLWKGKNKAAKTATRHFSCEE